MVKKHHLMPEIVLFDNTEAYRLYLSVDMCAVAGKTPAPGCEGLLLGAHEGKSYYFIDELCISNMNMYLNASGGGGKIMQIVLTMDKLTNPLVYPVRADSKYPPLIIKDIC